jgi:hypothetical protein
MLRTEYSSLRQGLVGAWCPSLGASGLSLIDRSGRNNHGALTNMGGQTLWVPGGGALSLQFDGSNDFVTMGNSPTHDVFSGNCTISLWARVASFPAAGASNRTILSKGERPTGTGLFNGLTVAYFSFSGINYVQAAFGASGTQNDTNCSGLSANTWFHCLWKIDGGNRFAFTNGAQTDSRSHSATVNSSTYDLLIGRQTGTSSYLDGAVDDARIYSRALTLAEIRLLASRRGIGLTPLPDRAAGLPRKLSVNVGGFWRAVDAYVHNGTSFRLGEAKINVGGVWK